LDQKLTFANAKTQTLEEKLALANAKTQTLEEKLALANANTQTLERDLALANERAQNFETQLFLANANNQNLQSDVNSQTHNSNQDYSQQAQSQGEEEEENPLFKTMPREDILFDEGCDLDLFTLSPIASNTKDNSILSTSSHGAAQATSYADIILYQGIVRSHSLDGSDQI